MIESFDTTSYIFGGDFNTVLDKDLDKSGGSTVDKHVKKREEIFKWLDAFDCVDIWRNKNPDKKRYTWRQSKPRIQCRLDYFLISTDLASCVKNSDILPGYKTDHSLIVTHFQITNENRGKGFWKFNASLLEDEDFVKLIKETINKTSSNHFEYLDSSSFWEFLKLSLRTETLTFSINRSKSRKKGISEL